MTKTKVTYHLTLAAVLMASLFTTMANAEDNRPEKRRGPPPEAIEACEGLEVDAACSFTGHRGDVTGVCFLPPKDDAVLACAPEGGPQKKHRDQ